MINNVLKCKRKHHIGLLQGWPTAKSMQSRPNKKTVVRGDLKPKVSKIKV